MVQGRQVVLVDYFINNDLEYLRGGSSSKKYTTSTTKTKADKYDIPGTEDMVPSLWSLIKEGDFPRLHLHDIEDMLLLLVQKKLLNLERDVIFYMGVALQMFTKIIVILKRVEDLQLGVKIYQKKLDNSKTLFKTEEVPQGKKSRAKNGLKRKQSSKHTSESKIKASKSKTGQSKKDTQSSLARDKSPSHHSPPKQVVGEMHKEPQQAVGGPTSLGVTSEEGAHPQLSSGSNPSVLVYKTKSARDGLKTAHTDSGGNEESRADDISLKVKLEDLSDILKDTRSAFFTPDSPIDEPIIVSDRVTELLVTSLKPELSKLLASHDFARCLPTKLKELPLKTTGLFGEIKKLKKHVRYIKIELSRDLKEILTKLETFTSIIFSLSSQVAELKNIQWELPAVFLNLPSQVSSVQEKLKTLDSLSSLLHKVTDTLNRFATMVDNALGARSMNVPSEGKATALPTKGEKNTKDADINLKDELVDLLGKYVVT
ncbi:hypothetical protein Tco_0052898 [Tanacetum coccineum]